MVSGRSQNIKACLFVTTLQDQLCFRCAVGQIPLRSKGAGFRGLGFRGLARCCKIQYAVSTYSRNQLLQQTPLNYLSQQTVRQPLRSVVTILRRLSLRVQECKYDGFRSQNQFGFWYLVPEATIFESLDTWVVLRLQ